MGVVTPSRQHLLPHTFAGTEITPFLQDQSMETKDIYSETVRHFLAPVLPLLDDPSVTEILINGHRWQVKPCRIRVSHACPAHGRRPKYR